MERKLPVLATLVAALDLCRAHFAYALKIIGPWFGILLIVPFISSAANIAPSPNEGSFENPLLDSLFLVLSVIAWGSIAVLWHWRVLRDDSQSGKIVIFDRRVFGYILRGILIGLFVVAVAFVVGLPMILIGRALIGATGGFYVFGAMMICLWVLIGIVFGRLSIALPAIALDHPKFGLGDAWNATQQNSFRLLIVTSLPLLLAMSLYWVLGLAGFEDTELYPSLQHWSVLRVLLHIWDFAVALFGLAVLSLTYAFFVDRRDKTALQEG